jgi:hypothetical protein
VSGSYCFWNSTRKKIDCQHGTNLMWVEYDPIPTSPTYNTWTKLTNYSTFCAGVTGCGQGHSISFGYDPVRKLAVGIGGTNNGVTGGQGTLLVTFTDFSTGSNYATQSVSTTGCSTPLMISSGEYPGMAYDPAREGFVVYPGSGNTVVFFNPTTRQCTSHTFAGGPTMTANSSPEGTFGRFGFSPSIGKYFFVGGTDANIFTFTLDLTPVYGLGASATVCLDVDGDGYGVGQVKVGRFTDLVIGASNTVSSASYTFPPAAGGAPSVDLARPPHLPTST